MAAERIAPRSGLGYTIMDATQVAGNRYDSVIVGMIINRPDLACVSRDGTRMLKVRSGCGGAMRTKIEVQALPEELRLGEGRRCLVVDGREL